MKINKIAGILFMFFMLQSTFVWCQVSDENWDLILMRVDKVYPSMTDEYEMTLVDLKDFLSRKKINGFNYFTHMQDNYHFTHAAPINQLKDLSNGIHSFVAKEVNDPELELIMTYLNSTIESYRYYVIRYQPQLSYIPEGDDWGEGSPYRKWSYYYFQPGTETEVEAVLGAWKNLYKDKGIKHGFRVFTGFIGTKQPLYILTTWGEDPLDYNENLQETISMLGGEGAVLWSKMMEYVAESNSIEGWFLPQYSYAPGLKLAD